MDGLRTEIEYERERRVHRDFRRARAKAIFGRLRRRVVRSLTSPGRARDVLECFDDYRAKLGGLCCTASTYATVEVERITGSVGRCTAFDSTYSPLCSCTSAKWISVARAVRDGTSLPPVELYRIGEAIFVYDGNHRVSVARSLGHPAVEAVVKDIFYEPLRVSPLRV